MSTGTTTTGPATTADPTPYLTSLLRDGFVHIPSLIPEKQVASLREAASHITSLARKGQWPHIRTVPKQFPPWPSTPPPASEGNIWGVQHLLHPEMPGREEFSKLYFSPDVLAVVEQLLGLKSANSTASASEKKERLVMELFNLLVSPTNKDFELRWHRDDVPTPPELSAEDELRQIQAKSPPGASQSHAQYNLALYPDTSLIVIPGSHRRARNEVERAAAPYEAHIPGQITVHMNPGDAVFYDSNIFHRGVYRGITTNDNLELVEGGDKYIRMTLHGSIGLADPDATAGAGSEGDKKKDVKVRARAVLQHGIGSWVGRPDAAFNIGERPEAMRKLLVEMGTGEDVGYSLEG